MQTSAMETISLPPIVTLEGSHAERARALSRLFGSEALRGRKFFGGLVSSFARQSMPASPSALFSRLDKTVYHLMGRSIAKHFSQDTKDLFAAMSKEDPLLGDQQEMLRSHLSLDLLFMMSVLSGKLHLSLPVPSTCSCLAAWGSASANGKLYVGRNFDFPAYRTDAPPSWLVLERAQGGIDHVSLYHAPGYMPGITSINREGVIVSALMNFSKKVSPFKAPVLAISKALIEGSKNIDDARSILRRMPPASGWTFFVAETNKRRAVVFEINPDGMGEIEPERDTLYAANRYRSQTLLGQDTPPSWAWHEHNIARETRLAEILKEHHGSLDAKKIAAALGDTFDPMSRSHRSLGPVISTAHNTGSAVFAPEDDSLFVATDGWPSNAAGTYVELNLGALFQGRTIKKGSLAPNRSGAARAGIVAYLQASSHLLSNHNEDAALASMEEAIQHEPNEPTFRTARAVILLRRNQAQQAAHDLESALTHETWAARRAFASLLLGNSYDLLQQREKAIAAYQKAMLGPEKQVAARAAKYSKKSFTPNEAKAIGFDPLLAAPV
jgi:tetratricopeptide (TPR) repeat protein